MYLPAAVITVVFYWRLSISLILSIFINWSSSVRRFISVWTHDINLVVWVTAKYYCYYLLKLFQLWTSRALSDWFLCLFEMLSSLFVVVGDFLTFWHHKMLQADLIFFITQPFLQRALVPFYWRIVFRNQDLGT